MIAELDGGLLATSLATLAAGLILGLFYYGGLWLTVRQLATTKAPAFLFMTSFIARTGVSVLGFYLITYGQVTSLAVCLVGFWLMRMVLVRQWRPAWN